MYRIQHIATRPKTSHSIKTITFEMPSVRYPTTSIASITTAVFEMPSAWVGRKSLG